MVEDVESYENIKSILSLLKLEMLKYRLGNMYLFQVFTAKLLVFLNLNIFSTLFALGRGEIYTKDFLV